MTNCDFFRHNYFKIKANELLLDTLTFFVNINVIQNALNMNTSKKSVFVSSIVSRVVACFLLITWLSTKDLHVHSCLQYLDNSYHLRPRIFI